MLKLQSIKSTLFMLTTASLIISSCDKEEDPEEIITAKGPYHNGVFITNEGSFMGNNGSVSYYSYSEDTTYDIAADSVYNGIYYKVNGRDLGDVVQSITLFDSLAFIVVNNSNKVEVVTAANFREKNVISGVSQPRYLLVNGTTAYISAWGEGGVVYIVDLTTFSVTSKIKAGNGPEKMLIDNNKLYVANSGGLYSDSTITVIDLETNQKMDSIIVGGNPKAMVKDKDGNKWVLCHGLVEYSPIDWSISRETPSLLVKLDHTDEIVNTIEIDSTKHPSILDINPAGDLLYFGGGYSYTGVNSISIRATSPGFEIVTDETAYGFMIEPNTGEIFVFQSPSFTDNGLLKRYTGNGTFLKEYTLGIGPNGGAASKKAQLH